jgi:hypothetical protein
MCWPLFCVLYIPNFLFFDEDRYGTMRICVEYTDCAFTKLWSYFYQVISVHSPLGVDPSLSVPNCQAFTQVLITLVLRIRIGFNAHPDHAL